MVAVELDTLLDIALRNQDMVNENVVEFIRALGGEGDPEHAHARVTGAGPNSNLV